MLQFVDISAIKTMATGSICDVIGVLLDVEKEKKTCGGVRYRKIKITDEREEIQVCHTSFLRD